MSRSKAAGAVVALALVLAGCGVGKDAHVKESDTRIDGVNVDVADLLIRDAHLVAPEGQTHPAGSDVALVLQAYNRADEADRLLSVSSPAASGARLTPSTIVVPGRGKVVLSPSKNSTMSGPLGSQAGVEPPSVLLTGLVRVLRPGTSMPVLLVFERAGEIEIQAPVSLPDEPVDEEPAVEPSPEATGASAGH